jgi:hypothetical protein
MSHRALFFLLCVIPCVACSGQSIVAERKAYWEKVVLNEIPVGTSREALDAWTRSRSLSVVEGGQPSTLIIGLETLPMSTAVCKGFGISLWVKTAANGAIAKEAVRSIGNCL